MHWNTVTKDRLIYNNQPTKQLDGTCLMGIFAIFQINSEELPETLEKFVNY